jgi:hypothetical protein
MVLGAFHKLIPSFPQKTALAACLLVIFAIASLQLYPFQPILPAWELEVGEEKTPVVWFHQVNTLNQYLMLDFALNRLDTEGQLITDYIGTRQAYMFFGPEGQNRVRITVYQRPLPSYILMHWPGEAGAFMEQAEYRSRQVISNWLEKPHMNTIYDNGGSFILYSPFNDQQPFHLEAYR